MVEENEEKPVAKRRPTMPLVAIGASAGGLESLEAFFSAAPVNDDWCFVVVQHLSPDYRSMMKNLLERQSHLRIQHVENGLELEPNTIYLNMPSEFVKLDGNRFTTRAYDEADGLPHLPIDYFFNSLRDRDPTRTVGIIMSGSGSDGTRGALAMHAVGATIFVQSPHEAHFDSMPQSVLKSGAVDRILSVADMPNAIADLLRYGKESLRQSAAVSSQMSQQIQEILKRQTSIDFSAYKPDLVLRRIERRQQLHGFRDIEEYRQLLLANPNAIDELYQDLLIGVTQFYRNPEAISALRTSALDVLVREKDEDDLIRVWVPACASGEEAYTIAIEISEALREAGVDRKFRVIATDVHRRSIDRASAGIYGEEALAKVDPRLMERYFVKHQGQYIVEPTLRQKLIFSVHDALSDPPFMHLDLISCRNLLIYLNSEPRARMISMFMFGLRKDGFLLLGPSETLGPHSDEFISVNQRWRLYRKASSRQGIDRSLLAERQRHVMRGDTYRQSFTDLRRPLTAQAPDSIELRNRDTLIKSYDALLKRYAPSSILISADGRVLSWFGAASAFIDTMNNLADWTIEDIVHPSLHFAINVGMEKLRRNSMDTYVRRVKVEFDSERTQYCSLTIEPLEQQSNARFLLVSIKLEEEKPSLPEEGALELSSNDDAALLSRRINELERDLRLTEETLQQVTERLEASGEELQASNEELQASNEELQASNEELQSSNEELHAVNEELVTVTAEHEQKITELSDLNTNMDLVLRILNVGVIVLDSEGRIRRFSELIGRYFEMEEHDVLRKLDVVGPRLDFVDLKKIVDATLLTGQDSYAAGDYHGYELKVEVHPVTHSGQGQGQGQGQGDEGHGAVLIFRGFRDPGAAPA